MGVNKPNAKLMKKYFLILIAASFYLHACKENEFEELGKESIAATKVLENSKWIRLPDYEYDGSSGSFIDPNGYAFAVGDKGYISGGNFDVNAFVEFNTTSKQYTVKSKIPLDFVTGLASFSIGTMGYVGSGTAMAGGGELYGLTDFFQYNTQTDTWGRKARLPQSLSGAVGFSINGKGYIGVGMIDTVKNNEFGVFETYYYPSRILYEYNPTSECWIKKADFPGDPRIEAVAFTIGDKAYVGTGLKFGRTGALKDFWEYDPKVNKWTRKADFPGASRYDAAGFSVGNKGYIGTGESYRASGPNIFHKDFWEYDPSLDCWQQTEDFPVGGRTQTIYFSTKSKGYVVGGNAEDILYHNALWEFDPSK
jgi:N-acetylneuraminic acid mutarotase